MQLNCEFVVYADADSSLEPCDVNYAGSSAASEPETQAIQKFALEVSVLQV